MADLAKLTLPNGTQVNLKDAWAREQIAQLSQYTKYLGVTTTALTDGATTNPITINGDPVTAVAGNITLYGNEEFIFDGTHWNLFGDLSALGDLAYKDTAEATYTPAGTVSQPTFTGTSSAVSMNITDSAEGNYQPKGSVSAPSISVSSAGTTTTIKNPTKQTVVKSVDAVAPGGTAPSNPLTYCAYDSATETLSLYQLGSTTGDSISTSDVTVKTGDASYTASAPTFTGTKASIEGSVTPAGSISTPTFSGTQATITVS